MLNETRHVPVLRDEVLAFFAPNSADGHVESFSFLDCTLGGAGHTRAILESFPAARGIAIDVDAQALVRAERTLAEFKDRVVLVQGNFGDLEELVGQALPRFFVGQGVPQTRFDRILADLGYSSDQMDDPERGFSFRGEGPLDMRLDRNQGLTAASVLNDLSERELRGVFLRGGLNAGEATKLVREVAANRPVTTTIQFAQICERVFPLYLRQKKNRSGETLRHPATVPFQALRIFVNREFDVLRSLLAQGFERLAPGGRFAVISFHSEEDRIVASTMRAWESPEQPRDLPTEPTRRGRLLTKKAVVPTDAEVAANPRSRSARLRVFEKQSNQHEAH